RQELIPAPPIGGKDGYIAFVALPQKAWRHEGEPVNGKEKTVAQHTELFQRLLDLKGCARMLGISTDTVDRLRIHAGLPAVDLGFPRPGRRAKRLWRFDPILVREGWLRR